MKVAIAAYKLLLEIAEAHQGLEPEEIKLLKRYRRALGISKEEILRVTATPIADRLIEGSLREREEALFAMACVALVDGRLSPVERARITEVAARLGVGRVQVANLLHRAEEGTLGPERRELRGGRRALGVLALVISILAIVFALRGSGDKVAAGLGEVAALRDPAVLLIRVEYAMTKGSDTRRLRGMGSGFIVSGDGLIVTCKHVVEPWKFLADPVQLTDAGFHLDPDTVRISAWPAGSSMRSERGEFIYGEAYDTRAGTLRLAATAPDHWVRGMRTLSSGKRHKGRYHALDDSDLAVLRATVQAPVAYIPVASEAASMRPLDPVVVLGFPRGTELLEGTRAVSSPSPGAVRKVEKTILLSAPIYPGNSGGPVLGADGEALGVAARRLRGEDGLGRCIQIAHVRELLGALQ